jgi:hypothetical protein
MLGFQFEAKRGLLIFPALFVGYSITDYVLQFFCFGISTKWDINVVDYNLTIFWKIGKSLKDH